MGIGCPSHRTGVDDHDGRLLASPAADEVLAEKRLFDGGPIRLGSPAPEVNNRKSVFSHLLHPFYEGASLAPLSIQFPVCRWRRADTLGVTIRILLQARKTID